MSEKSEVAGKRVLFSCRRNYSYDIIDFEKKST